MSLTIVATSGLGTLSSFEGGGELSYLARQLAKAESDTCVRVRVVLKLESCHGCWYYSPPVPKWA